MTDIHILEGTSGPLDPDDGTDDEEQIAAIDIPDGVSWYAATALASADRFYADDGGNSDNRAGIHLRVYDAELGNESRKFAGEVNAVNTNDEFYNDFANVDEFGSYIRGDELRLYAHCGERSDLYDSEVDAVHGRVEIREI